jgi:hypothetical protein
MGPLRFPEMLGTDYPVTQHNISDEQKIQWHRRESLKTCMMFKVCKSVHHHTIQINQPSTIYPVYYLTFIYSSTCFGRPYAHHQELNNCSNSL